MQATSQSTIIFDGWMELTYLFIRLSLNIITHHMSGICWKIMDKHISGNEEGKYMFQLITQLDDL